jgi:polyisoprenyl-phosphate glycosyltransferase
MSGNIHLSIVSPVYKSEPLVDSLVERIRSAVSEITNSYEIILIEDRGPDNSWKKIEDNCKRYQNVIGLRLSRNFGQQHAIQAGLDASKGEWVVVMDCDLQDMPEEIIKLYNKGQEGFEIVQAQRANRQDDFVKRSASNIFNKVLGYLTDTEQDPTIANFTLFHRKVVDAFNSLKDHNRYYPMLAQWVGFNRAKIVIDHADREIGKSSYSLRKRMGLAIDTILTFSDKPLRLTVKAGVLLTFFSILAGFSLIVVYILVDIVVPGWASLALLLCFFSGSIISILGMIGLYTGKTFETVKRRPTYIIDTKMNI